MDTLYLWVHWRMLGLCQVLPRSAHPVYLLHTNVRYSSQWFNLLRGLIHAHTPPGDGGSVRTSCCLQNCQYSKSFLITESSRSAYLWQRVRVVAASEHSNAHNRASEQAQ